MQLYLKIQNVHTQGLDTSGMTAEITDYQNKVGQATEQALV